MRAITFKEIVDAVLFQAFDDTQRNYAKNWVNYRYTWICDSEEWTFTTSSSAAVGVTSGSNLVSGMPTDFGRPYALYHPTGYELAYLPEDEYEARYFQSAQPQYGIPEVFSQIGDQLVVGPASQETRSDYLLLYQRTPPLLVNDTDVPIIPAGYHQALVDGGRAEGFKYNPVPGLDGPLEESFQAAVTTMRKKYRRGVPHRRRQSPAYRPC